MINWTRPEMQEKPKHTALPWKADHDMIHMAESPYSMVANSCTKYKENYITNAEFIAHACNCYYDLLEALSLVYHNTDRGQFSRNIHAKIDAALAKAKGDA